MSARFFAIETESVFEDDFIECFLQFSIDLHEVFFRQKNCQNEQCILVACYILQKIEDVCVPSIEFLIHC